MDARHRSQFGTLLRRYRLQAGLSQEALAERSGLSLRGISDLERGVRTSPRFETVRLLADALALSGDVRDALIAAARSQGDAQDPRAVSTGMAPIPRPPSPLIGRDHEFRAVRELLQQGDVSLVTLTGPGGVGKTRLALSVASEMSPEFPDGVVFIPLADIGDPGLVVLEVRKALGVRDTGGQSVIELLRGFLRTKRTLLVIDNFEHVLGAAPFVADLLSYCAAIKVLVTSREGLHLRGERLFDVAPLRVPESHLAPTVDALQAVSAVQLFVERGREVRSGFRLMEQDASAVAEICRRLDGLPLALELAAAWIDVLPPPALLGRLGQSLNRGARDAPARQQTLRETIAWSYNLLTADEQRAFRHLSVFVGGFDMAAAEVLFGNQFNMDAVDMIASLSAKSLLERIYLNGSTRMRMLETIREFARESLASSGEAHAVREAHATYFLSFAESLRPRIEGIEGPLVLDRMENEHANLRAALDWAVECEEGETALRLTAAMWKFWWVHRHLRDGRAMAERTLSRSSDVAPALRAEAHYGAGSLAMGMGDLQGAKAHGESGLELAKQIDDPFWTAMPLNLLGNIARFQGDYAAARVRFEQALAIYRHLNASHPAAMVLVSLGAVAYGQGDLDEAVIHNEEALEIWRGRGDLWGQGIALINLGAVALMRGDPVLAVEHYRESINRQSTAGDRAAIGEALSGIALAVARLGLLERAARLFGAAEAAREAAGSPHIAMIGTYRDRELGALRASLDEEVLANEWQTGREMSIEVAVAHAMEPIPDPSPPAATGTSCLSGRELDVLHLIAEGRSNREIADELFISVRTVTTHTTSIFTKLGAKSRTAAVAVAHEQGLLKEYPHA